ncbi:vWA domain-containing protein [Sphingomonas immobilis]|uniref:VWA domain-containing protein n=1 Tax=Sphingomonas immobilis TaxID=3063997 RepID=A0ABT8ZXS0_9SPHN|nr:VWA domain-containing protein [Sphingomonas sp. CA1-15]MDO7842349.1 VWA domain-containing protein [Sphingomonas sp. CA1-15]
MSDLSHPHRFARAIACVAVTLCLAACDSAKAPADASATGADVSSASALFDRFVKSEGADFEACFAGEPVMAGPGALQSLPGRAAAPVKIASLIIAIDASGSMAARIGGETKMDAAKRAAASFLASVPAGTRVGLVAFGHKGDNSRQAKAASCSGVETLYPLGQANAAEVTHALEGVKATGWTPLASAISTAGKAFAPGPPAGAQVIYVVSDGLETCGGDPVAAARALNGGPVKAIVNVIGFDLSAADRAQLQAVAAAGGGAFVEAGSGRALSDTFADLLRKAQAVSAITTERFDAGGRIAANSMAVGRYTTNLNLCIAHAAAAESGKLPRFLDASGGAAGDREAARTDLVTRHERYRTRSQQVADRVAAAADRANAAITAQAKSSEGRLGVDR